MFTFVVQSGLIGPLPATSPVRSRDHYPPDFVHQLICLVAERCVCMCVRMRDLSINVSMDVCFCPCDFIIMRYSDTLTLHICVCVHARYGKAAGTLLPDTLPHSLEVRVDCHSQCSV